MSTWTTKEIGAAAVNVAGYEIFNFKVTESLPPNSPFGRLLTTSGVQTTPQLARGFLPGSTVDLLNRNLAHVCDFKFIFNININLIGGLLSPVALIQRAIRNAKLKAANRLRALIQEGVLLLRRAIDALLKVIGFDPSGQISFFFSLGKDLIRKVNEILEWIAEKLEIVLEWVFFAQQIKQLIDWILSLPEKIKKLLQDCLTNFTNSLRTIADNVLSIPDQITNLTRAQINQIAQTFTQGEQALVDNLQLNQQDAGIPPAVILALNAPPEESAEALTQYIQESVPSANTISANTTTSMMANTSGP
jgi:hypothetical protein